MALYNYSDALSAIDDELVALNRPQPPLVAELGGTRVKWPERFTAWRRQLVQWEADQPKAARQWAELRAKCIGREEYEEKQKWDEAEWGFRLLERVGAPMRSLDVIRRRFEENSAMRGARAWLADGTTWSLVITGGPGSGKTTAAAFAAHQMHLRQVRPAWVDCTATIDEQLFGPTADAKRARCREAGVLVLDDLGSSARERDSAKAPAAWLDWLDGVLARRHGSRAKTIITTNRSWKWLETWLGARLTDRLLEGALCSAPEPSMRRMPVASWQDREPGDDR